MSQSRRWSLEEQAVQLEPVPPSLARAFAGEGVETWADAQRIPVAQLLTYPGVGRGQLAWMNYELRLRSAAVVNQDDGSVSIPLVPGPAKRSPELTDRAGVYFIQCGQFVKIGLGKSVRRRFRAIRRSMPFRVDLLGVVVPESGKTLRQLEREYHVQFKAFRQRGEWFRIEGELETFCLELTKATVAA